MKGWGGGGVAIFIWASFEKDLPYLCPLNNAFTGPFERGPAKGVTMHLLSQRHNCHRTPLVRLILSLSLQLPLRLPLLGETWPPAHQHHTEERALGNKTMIKREGCHHQAFGNIIEQHNITM